MMPASSATRMLSLNACIAVRPREQRTHHAGKQLTFVQFGRARTPVALWINTYVCPASRYPLAVRSGCPSCGVPGSAGGLVLQFREGAFVRAIAPPYRVGRIGRQIARAVSLVIAHGAEPLHVAQLRRGIARKIVAVEPQAC